MYKTIIVPIDLSHPERGKQMFEVARKLGADGARLIVVHAVEEVPGFVAAELPSGFAERSRKVARQELDRLVGASGIKAEADIRAGRAHRAILEAADENDADLIVIASHSPGFQDYLLGSTAARVVRHAKCSVHVVR